jgi:hypothetical protein
MTREHPNEPSVRTVPVTARPKLLRHARRTTRFLRAMTKTVYRFGQTHKALGNIWRGRPDPRRSERGTCSFAFRFHGSCVLRAPAIVHTSD